MARVSVGSAASESHQLTNLSLITAFERCVLAVELRIIGPGQLVICPTSIGLSGTEDATELTFSTFPVIRTVLFSAWVDR